MYPCVAVPYAVTALYVFAVINLTALLNISLVEASVHVVSKNIISSSAYIKLLIAYLINAFY